MNPLTQRSVTRTLAACAAAILLMVVDVMAQTPTGTPRACGHARRGADAAPIRRRSRLQRCLGTHTCVGHGSRGRLRAFRSKNGRVDAAQPHQ